MTAQPLMGLKVLDFSKVFAGPICTQHLGDMGAEVIKVETLVRGDDTRGWPQFRDVEGGYGLTIKGAYLLTWRELFPVKQAIRMRIRREASKWLS